MRERLGVQESNELSLVVEGTLKIYSIPRIHKPAHLVAGPNNMGGWVAQGYSGLLGRISSPGGQNWRRKPRLLAKPE